ncbi:MAG: VanZ family protein [Clostridia bacterium]|nr:VanZ family protein [Clostridia bacterium]
MKRHLLRIFFILMLLATFVAIFNFSNQDGKTSSGVSKKVARKIIDIFPYTKNLSEATKVKMVEKSQPIIRKLAHFSIYTLVGISIMAFISTYNRILLKKFIISLSVGLVYAISDEIHQSFVPGRGPSVKDVCIDTSGVFLGIIIVLVIISVFKALSEGVENNKKRQGTKL